LSDAPGEVARPSTKTLVKNVRVLAADQQVERKQQTQPPKTVTLEVSEDDAKRLTLAGTVGQLSLTLNRGDGPRVAGRAVDLRDIVGTAEPSEDGVAGAPVSVFRSVERKEYRVPQQASSGLQGAQWGMRFGAASAR
jgi:pilus assembly protein CpaB